MGQLATACLIVLLTVPGTLPAGAANISEPEVVARVGDRTISRAELDREVQRAINSSYFHKRLPPEVLEKLRRRQLQALIHRDLDILGAYDHGLKPARKDAEGRRAAMEIQLGKERYERSLKINGWTREDHTRVLAETLMGQEAHRRFVTEKARVSEKAVREAYEANPGRWKMPPSLHILHILLKVPPSAEDAVWKRREAEAREIKAEAEAGTPFSDLASKRSEGMYRIKGGDLGWVHKGRLQSELEKAAWGAKTGTVVGPIRTREGIHLLLVTERRPAHQLSFAEAEPIIRKQLEHQALRAAEKRWYDEVTRRHPVVILDPALRQDAGEE